MRNFHSFRNDVFRTETALNRFWGCLPMLSDSSSFLKARLTKLKAFGAHTVLFFVIPPYLEVF